MKWVQSDSNSMLGVCLARGQSGFGPRHPIWSPEYGQEWSRSDSLCTARSNLSACWVWPKNRTGKKKEWGLWVGQVLTCVSSEKIIKDLIGLIGFFWGFALLLKALFLPLSHIPHLTTTLIFLSHTRQCSELTSGHVLSNPSCRGSTGIGSVLVSSLFPVLLSHEL